MGVQDCTSLGQSVTWPVSDPVEKDVAGVGSSIYPFCIPGKPLALGSYQEPSGLLRKKERLSFDL